ncbi:MFS transporter [Nocardia macrotermitis]|uniref:Multidrug resistance protein Stp n=1 Tax=Nocardia macrotermitis TaxID=2585198 RepID=A0A7K0DCT2_9NOCA|nr:MFS transporter [Nocardia macrotermitis]MQY23580.1 Multidrug resistance protein Stp [Nocardia macrotermitis]
MTTAAVDAASSEEVYSRRWAAMVILILGFMLDLLNVTIVNVGLPSIQTDLGGTPAQVGWIATAYLLAFAATLITSARLGDLWGRKRMFLLGLAVFALAGVWSALAHNPDELIAARAAQGAAAAILAPQVLTSLFVLFRGPERATVLGMFGVVAGLAQAGGLLLGGVLVTADVAGLGWRAIFWVSVPAALIVFLLGVWLIPESRAEDALRPRWSAAAVLTAGLVAIVFPLLEGSAYHWVPWIWLLLVAGVAVVVSVAAVEHRDPARRLGALLPLDLLRQRTSSVALLVQLVAFGAFSGFLLVFVLWLQDGQGYSALEAGGVSVAFSAGALIGSPLVGRLTMRFGRFTVVAGTLLGAVGTLAVLGAASAAADRVNPWLLTPGLFIVGIGITLVQPPLTTLFLSRVSPRYAGSASGIWTTAQQFGGAIGTASLSAVFFGAVAAGGYRSALTVSGLTIIGALILAAVCCLALPATDQSAAISQEGQPNSA